MLAVGQRPPVNLFGDQESIAGPSRSPDVTPLPAPIPRRGLKTQPREDGEDVKPSSPAKSPSKTPSRPPSRTEKKFKCEYEGCDKAYTKPARLKEHQLSHTGERPHVCPHCSNSYLRSTHLTAHMRTHLDETKKEFTCEREGCGKSFWTATHLRRHKEGHDNVNTYHCEHCDESFHKQNQLRNHVALAHMPAGTKPYICQHEGCSASFAIHQQLKTHMKTHDATRYTCSHPSHDEPPSFPNWTALQEHLHTAHIVTCPHPQCHSRAFRDEEKLQIHLQTHTEQGASSPIIKADLDIDIESDTHDEPMRKRKSDSDRKGKNEAKRIRVDEDEPQGTVIEHDTRRYGCPSELIHGKPEMELKCYSRFWRIYDVKRHLNTAHGVKLDTEEVKELLDSRSAKEI